MKRRASRARLRRYWRTPSGLISSLGEDVTPGETAGSTERAVAFSVTAISSVTVDGEKWPETGCLGSCPGLARTSDGIASVLEEGTGICSGGGNARSLSRGTRWAVIPGLPSSARVGGSDESAHGRQESSTARWQTIDMKNASLNIFRSANIDSPPKNNPPTAKPSGGNYRPERRSPTNLICRACVTLRSSC